jgi:hypothetical protein
VELRISKTSQEGVRRRGELERERGKRKERERLGERE